MATGYKIGKIAIELNHGEGWNLGMRGRMVVARLAWPSGEAPFRWAAKYGKIRPQLRENAQLRVTCYLLSGGGDLCLY
jgi:hypothetical protein